MAAALLGLLAACGGGGDEPPRSIPTPSTPAPATATCGLNDLVASALTRINQFRAAGADCRSGGNFAPAAALAWNDRLGEAAAAHSRDMAANNYFSHTSLDGRTFDQRIDATGYTWSNAGENIAAGYPSVASVIDGWMTSDGHCANLMNPNFSEVGLACVPGTATSTYNTYWTMDLARPR